ncbi:23S rRNA (uracil(1939)-C(5))-methyltransferase RlmD [Tuanshanicoccus lijuaniae]|uniref:23S rRNA (uracil(1939)-C(5))-methyltransferase RlmD n=1 Tax=Aerococcaceae bacterium zg-1292 TaxID=2774330 RepID=UPI001937F800|nr:23S rRNA (uracil(1939)-C(5))-methyltransferase RlmD [Aerococcaceae bacterium zg-1292]QQA37011.1 23S rRNA (uracil(1939)-C(5))-methyltransferase RlmD [Aerococcaceae bacterium zg-1292]
MKQVFKKNQEIVGLVEDLTSEGLGVIRVEGFAFFVEGGIPGEIIHAKVMKVGKNFGFARLIEIENPSYDRQEMVDVVGRQIGTMALQHMSYDLQLAFKQETVRKAFRKIGGFKQAQVRMTLGMPHPWAYRNKAQIPVRTIDGKLETGFFRKNTHDLVPVKNFHIQHPEIDRAVHLIRNVLRKFNVSAYDEVNHTGQVRHIIVKRGHYSGEMMVVLVVNGSSLPNEIAIAKEIMVQLPEVVSVVLNRQDKKTNVIMGESSRVLEGEMYYQDRMLGYTYFISAHSFYQVNTPQAEVLYKEAIRAANLTGNEIVLDAYCGIGTITLPLTQRAKHVYAMEVVPQAIEMANKNAAYNYVKNVTFEVGKAEDVLPRWNEAGVRFDTVVVDPPRKGLDRQFVDSVIEQAPGRIVYVSCNPATCARDCKLFAEAGYQLDYVQPVDMFPQTTSIECVVLMTKDK